MRPRCRHTREYKQRVSNLMCRSAREYGYLAAALQLVVLLALLVVLLASVH